MRNVGMWDGMRRVRLEELSGECTILFSSRWASSVWEMMELQFDIS